MSFRHYFYLNRDERGHEREKKNFSPEFRPYLTRARKLKKKISKKIQKIKKHHFGIISIQTGMRYAEKEKKKIVPNSVPTLPVQENSKKSSQKIKKTSFRHYFYPNRVNIGREREKTILVPNSIPTRLGQEN